MSTVVDLNDENVTINSSKDGVVIVDCFAEIRGGRSLNVAGFTPSVIQAGHPIIMETSTKDYKPMPVTVLGALVSQGAVVPGSGYTNNGTYNAVALTGGSGSGATANIVVAGNAVSSVTLVNKGTGYKAGDILSAAAANIGTNGSGFAMAITAVDGTGSAYGSLPAGHQYAGILRASILRTKPLAGIMTQGTVNPAAAPFAMTSILSAVRSALPLIDFRED